MSLPARHLLFTREHTVRVGLFSLVLCLSLGMGACGDGDGESGKSQADLAGRTIRVVTTTGMINDIVLNVGGERVQSEALMGAGVDPHMYKASEGDVRRLSAADVIFFNGLHLEAKMAEILKRMNTRVRTVAVAEAMDASSLMTPPDFQGNPDPHVWMDVSLWMEAAATVRNTLAEQDPEHAEQYRINADAYLAELQVLHIYVTERVATIPVDQRVLITAHDAFGYFGRAYDIQVRGLQGISTVTEAGTADVQGLAEFISSRRIPAIFVESSVPPRAIEAVQAAVQARGFTVAIGGELFSDAMGNPGTPEGTYVGMIRHNVDTVVEGLKP